MITIVVSRIGSIDVDTNDLDMAYAVAKAASADDIYWHDEFEATDHVLEEDRKGETV